MAGKSIVTWKFILKVWYFYGFGGGVYLMGLDYFEQRDTCVRYKPQHCELRTRELTASCFNARTINQWTIYTWKADSSSKSEATDGGIWSHSCAASPPVLYVHGCTAIYLTVRVGDWGWRTRMASNSAIFGFTFWLRNWLKSAFHVYIVHCHKLVQIIQVDHQKTYGYCARV